MPFSIRVDSRHQPILVLFVVDGIKVAALEEGVKDQRRVLDQHALLPNGIVFKVRVVFLEESLQEL